VLLDVAHAMDAFAEAAIKRLRDDPAEQIRGWIAELNEVANRISKELAP
jgi:hypothetical protein